MGMSVNGREPRSAAGEYFGASIFNWPIYLAAMEAAGLDVPESWSYNDGHGLRSQDECDRYADALEARFATVSATTVVLSPDHVGNRIATVFGGPPVVAVTSDPERMRQWIEFLRNCGGFTIN